MSNANNFGGRKKDACWFAVNKVEDPNKPGDFIYLCKQCGEAVSPRPERIKSHSDDIVEEGGSASSALPTTSCTTTKKSFSDFFFKTTEQEKKVKYMLYV
jgi:hypothetical protein